MATAVRASARQATSSRPRCSPTPLDARVFNDEPFGPVAAIRAFNTLEEAIAEANRLPYGSRRLRLHPFAEERPPAQPARRGGHVVDQPAALPLPEMPFGGVGRFRLRLGGWPGGPEAYLNSRAVSIANVSKGPAGLPLRNF